MNTLSPFNYHFINKTDDLNGKNNTSKYATLHFKGGKALISDTGKLANEIDAVKKPVIALLLALGLEEMITQLNLKPLTNKIKLIQTDITKKNSDMQKRNDIKMEFYNGTNYADTIEKYYENLSTLLATAQKYLNDFKNEIKSKQDNKTLTEEEFNTQFAELQTKIAQLNDEYNKIDSECKNIENSRYEELAKQMLAVEPLINDYTKLDKEYKTVINQEVDDKDTDKQSAKRAKEHELVHQRWSLQKQIAEKLGFEYKFHPYFIKNGQSHPGLKIKNYNIPEWITTPAGERPYTKISNVSYSYSYTLDDDRQKQLQTIHGIKSASYLR